MYDIVKTHGTALRDFERQLASRTSKAELTAALNLKANVNDVSRSIADLSSGIDQRPTSIEMDTMFEDKVSKTDLQ